MQMNDIIEGLGPECQPGPPMNFDGGCGFGSWIWILLILFYTNNQPRTNGCCGNGNAYAGNNGCTSGAGGYLFLLVILFLSGGHNRPEPWYDGQVPVF